MGLLEAIILGIVQGLTEFLPVSSSGHLELVKALFGESLVAEESLLFTIILHGATALSTVVVFRKDIADLFRGLFKFQWNAETKYVAFIALSMIPVFIVGMLFRHEIEAMFTGNLILVGGSLMFTAALLYSTTRIPDYQGELTAKRVILIGIAQAVAVLPGVSRSGSTISVALLSGVGRDKAARFSFLMVLPVIFGAMILQAKDFVEEGATRELEITTLAAGFVAAFLAGILACSWMIKIVKRSKLDYFAYYCAAVGIIAAAYGLLT